MRKASWPGRHARYFSFYDDGVNMRRADVDGRSGKDWLVVPRQRVVGLTRTASATQYQVARRVSWFRNSATLVE